MTENDILYFRLCYQLGLIKSPFLEIGSAKVQRVMPNLCDLARDLKVEQVRGVDMIPGEGVDFTCDFSVSPEDFHAGWVHGTFATVAVFNVLEHTFDPIAFLHNALHCVASGGTLLVVTPAVWPLHNWPVDCVRLMPHWYEEFARQFGLSLVPDAFCWLSQFGIIKVSNLISQGRGGYQLPTFHDLGRSQSIRRYWVSRFIHRIFDTYGRSHSFTHAAIGAAFVVP
jgi:SAM-dependent methyltransferase